MRGYLFDTMVHTVAKDSIPLKWKRHWKEATTGRKKLILFEPLVAEILNQLTRTEGEKAARDRILWIKALRTVKMVGLDDRIAFEASKLYLKLRKHRIGLVDSFLLAIAKKERAKIFTSDSGLRDAAKEIDVKISFLPISALK